MVGLTPHGMTVAPAWWDRHRAGFTTFNYMDAFAWRAHFEQQLGDEGVRAALRDEYAVIEAAARAEPGAVAALRRIVGAAPVLWPKLEHRARLAALGVRFDGRSDTEVLLRLLEREGTAALDDVTGMFAFGLLDRTERRLTLARDPFGIKPLLYARGDDGIRFGSEAAALVDGPPKIDREALIARMAFQVPLSDRTLIDGVRTLPAGSETFR